MYRPWRQLQQNLFQTQKCYGNYLIAVLFDPPQKFSQSTGKPYTLSPVVKKNTPESRQLQILWQATGTIIFNP